MPRDYSILSTRLNLTMIHGLFVYVQTLTPSKLMEQSSQNFQGIIRAPHCISLRRFHSNYVAVGMWLALGVLLLGMRVLNNKKCDSMFFRRLKSQNTW